MVVMTTRSGTSYKKTESAMTEVKEGAEAVSVTGMIRLILEERQRQQVQLEWLMQLVERSYTGIEGRPSAGVDKVKLTKLTKQDDIEAYIITFERMMAKFPVHAGLTSCPQSSRERSSKPTLQCLLTRPGTMES